ncbi:MAG: hypothetical protein ABJC55_09560 [Algoriphagus sp.]
MKKFLLAIPVFFILSFAEAQVPTPDAYRKAQSELAAKTTGKLFRFSRNSLTQKNMAIWRIMPPFT